MSALSVLIAIAVLHQTDGAEASLTALRDRAAATRMALLSKSPAEFQFVRAPLFRYSDQLRNIEDAGLWIWTRDGRPAAVLKVERYVPGVLPSPWVYCFTSVSSEKIVAEWDGLTTFQSTKPGVEWKPLADAPAVSESRAIRLTQMREIARRFSAELIGKPDGSNRRQMRLIPRPLFRYAEGLTDGGDGAVFGFSGTGTNPDLLLLLDFSQNDGWRFGFSGMTAEGLAVSIKDQPVWEAPHTAGMGNVFETWAAFYGPRDKQ